MDFSTFTQNNEVNRLLNLVMYHYNLQDFPARSILLSGQACKELQESPKTTNEIKNVTFITEENEVFEWFQSINKHITEAKVMIFKDNVYVQLPNLTIDVYLSPTAVTHTLVGDYDCQLKTEIPTFLL